MNNEVAEYREVPTTTVAQRTGARPLIMAEVLSIETEQRKLLGQYVRNHMVKGTDYGTIPGTDKDTLLKPGAEKLVDLFRCTPVYDIVERIEDWDKPLFHYLFRVRIESRESGLVVAEGFGSANSREGRYRWRNASRKCPSCGKEAIIKGKAEYGGGWVCFKKKDGCNAKFADGDQSIEGQAAGRVENPDICDQANTILKMAKKRALVDASIALARCSDLFTQDAEDFADVGDEPSREPASYDSAKNKPTPISDEQINAIEAGFVILGRSWKEPGYLKVLSERLKRSLDPNAGLHALTADEGVEVKKQVEFWIQKRAEQQKAKQPEPAHS